MDARPLRLMVIGTLPPPIGGGSISLKHLVEALARREDVRTVVANTSGIRGHKLAGPFRFLGVVARIAANMPRVDVVTLHLAATAVPLFGPVVCFLAKLFGRPLILRKFGGHVHELFGGLRRRLFDWVVRRVDLYLLQTQELMRSAEQDGLSNVAWYPTSRPMLDAGRLPSRNGSLCRRFVYVGHVKPAKGIGQIIDAAERLTGEVEVDVYGPFHDGLSEETFVGRSAVRYKGVIPPGDAVAVMSRYDALLLPTYWEGEGYPGVLLEAFSAGLPVVTTRWMSIPEIVDESCGILLKPKDAEGLYQAMQRLSHDTDLYRRLCEGVAAKRAFFDTARWTQELIDHARRLGAQKDIGNPARQ